MESGHCDQEHQFLPKRQTSPCEGGTDGFGTQFDVKKKHGAVALQVQVRGSTGVTQESKSLK